MQQRIAAPFSALLARKTKSGHFALGVSQSESEREREKSPLMRKQNKHAAHECIESELTPPVESEIIFLVEQSDAGTPFATQFAF
jgi:hypothetical protein